MARPRDMGRLCFFDQFYYVGGKEFLQGFTTGPMIFEHDRKTYDSEREVNPYGINLAV